MPSNIIHLLKANEHGPGRVNNLGFQIINALEYILWPSSNHVGGVEDLYVDLHALKAGKFAFWTCEQELIDKSFNLWQSTETYSPRQKRIAYSIPVGQLNHAHQHIAAGIHDFVLPEPTAEFLETKAQNP